MDGNERPAKPAAWRDPAALRAVAYAVVALAGAWWLLGQLAGVLRPLLVAVLLSYRGEGEAKIMKQTGREGVAHGVPDLLGDDGGTDGGDDRVGPEAGRPEIDLF